MLTKREKFWIRWENIDEKMKIYSIDEIIRESKNGRIGRGGGVGVYGMVEVGITSYLLEPSKIVNLSKYRGNIFSHFLKF